MQVSPGSCQVPRHTSPSLDKTRWPWPVSTKGLALAAVPIPMEKVGSCYSGPTLGPRLPPRWYSLISLAFSEHTSVADSGPESLLCTLGVLTVKTPESGCVRGSVWCDPNASGQMSPATCHGCRVVLPKPGPSGSSPWPQSLLCKAGEVGGAWRPPTCRVLSGSLGGDGGSHLSSWEAEGRLL